MKKLLLLRHAKSSWGAADLTDFERPLNERGRRDAPLVGEFIREQGLRPDLVISSPAQRTRETIALVIEAAGIEVAERVPHQMPTNPHNADYLATKRKKSGHLLV